MALNSQVTVQRPASAEDELGQPISGWQDVCTVWSEIRHPSGVEQLKAGAEVSTVRASVKVRARSDIAPAMRLLHGAAVYNITAVLPDQVGRIFMFLACERQA